MYMYRKLMNHLHKLNNEILLSSGYLRVQSESTCGIMFCQPGKNFDG